MSVVPFFDFRVLEQFGQEDFNRSVVNGAPSIKEVIRGLGREDLEPYLACSFTLDGEGGFSAARWVGDGPVDGASPVSFKAASLFPLAPQDLFLSIKPRLEMFDFPGNGANFSSYLDVPRDMMVAAFYKDEATKAAGVAMGKSGAVRYVDWEEAKGSGCADFAVRAIVLPSSTKQAFAQIGAVPFSVMHMMEHYQEASSKPYFPNFMLSVTKTPTKLPPGGKSATSRLVRAVDLEKQDEQGFGLGVVPFFNTIRMNPKDVPVVMPDFAVIQKSLYDFMRAGFLPTAKTAAQMTAALGVAVQLDKHPANRLRPVASPWPVLHTAAMMSADFAG